MYKLVKMALLAGVALAVMARVAMAATGVSGTAVGVTPAATDQGKTSKTLKVGSDVVMGDKIVTGASGQVQLVFTDDTHLVVGPNSALLIQSYLLNSDKTVGQFAVSALGGSFRFITGKSDHSAYTISTPTGTIGVRGTAFDFTTAFADSYKPPHPTNAAAGFLPGTWVALFRGAVQLCDLQNPRQCIELTRRCDLGQITTPKATRFGMFESREMGARKNFRYIESQKPLMPDFWINESTNCFLDPGPPNPPSELVNASTPELYDPERFY